MSDMPSAEWLDGVVETVGVGGFAVIAVLATSSAEGLNDFALIFRTDRGDDAAAGADATENTDAGEQDTEDTDDTEDDEDDEDDDTSDEEDAEAAGDQ